MDAEVIVIGGGAVGCEFASYFRDLGAETTIVEMLPALVPLEDCDASKELTRAFTKRGIAIPFAFWVSAKSMVAGSREFFGPTAIDMSDVRWFCGVIFARPCSPFPCESTTKIDGEILCRVRI